MTALSNEGSQRAVVANNVNVSVATILVVDDEPQIRSAVRRFLQIKGHEVLKACDGVEALEVLADQGVDVAIVDLMMPRMHGVELINRMKSEFPEVRVVVMSAYSEVSGLSVAESDVVALLKKPFELRDLADAVELALGEGQGAANS